MTRLRFVILLFSSFSIFGAASHKDEGTHLKSKLSRRLRKIQSARDQVQSVSQKSKRGLTTFLIFQLPVLNATGNPLTQLLIMQHTKVLITFKFSEEISSSLFSSLDEDDYYLTTIMRKKDPSGRISLNHVRNSMHFDLAC